MDFIVGTIETLHSVLSIVGRNPETLFFEVREILSGGVFKVFAEMCRIGKTQVVSDFFHTEPRIHRLAFCLHHNALPDVIACRNSGRLFYNFIQIIGRDGQKRRIGKFELANNSTLFLDEIGEMVPELQVKLLRALQEKEIERIGGKSAIKINVRIIAATNRNLQQEVEAGRFRNDLYYRLNVFPILLFQSCQCHVNLFVGCLHAIATI